MQHLPTPSLLARVDRAWPQHDPLADPSRTRAHDDVNHGYDQPCFGVSRLETLLMRELVALNEARLYVAKWPAQRPRALVLYDRDGHTLSLPISPLASPAPP